MLRSRELDPLQLPLSVSTFSSWCAGSKGYHVHSLWSVLYIKCWICRAVSPAGIHPRQFYENCSMCVWWGWRVHGLERREGMRGRNGPSVQKNIRPADLIGKGGLLMKGDLWDRLMSRQTAPILRCCCVVSGLLVPYFLPAGKRESHIWAIMRKMAFLSSNCPPVDGRSPSPTVLKVQPSKLGYRE